MGNNTKIKAIAAAVSAVSIIAAATGCTTSAVPKADGDGQGQSVSVMQLVTTGISLSGGWEVVDEGRLVAEDTPDRPVLFEKAAKGTDLEGYEFVAQPAYTFHPDYTEHDLMLVKAPEGSDKAPWALAAVYDDMSGEIELTSWHELDINSPKAAEDGTGADWDGWGVVKAEPTAKDEPLESIAEALSENSLNGICVLGQKSQGDGIAYRVLCQGDANEKGHNALYMTDVEADGDGNMSLGNSVRLDLSKYVDAPEGESNLPE